MHMTHDPCELTIITGHAWVEWDHSQAEQEIETKEAQGNNLMVCNSLILAVSAMLAGEKLSVAYLKSLMQIYTYHGGDDIWNHLETSPFVRFNKDGMLRAVLIHVNEIKILANPDGVGLLRTTKNSSFDPSGAASTPVAKGQVCHLYLRLLLVQTSAITTFGTVSASEGPSTTDKTPLMPPMTLMNSEKRNLVDRPRIGDEAIDKSMMWKVTEISEPLQCLSLRLPDNTSSLMQVTNLVYTNSGLGVLALVANAVHKL
ncbi:topless-related protein 4-like protein isoform X1 [Tanacetum coccineum]